MIITSTRDGMDVITWKDMGKVINYCIRMDKLGITYQVDF